MRRPPTIVAASAGSGKTYRLTQEVISAIGGASPQVRLEGLVAVTYTRKAQAELAARIRRVLVGAGAFDAAARLPVAYLGTVHSVCMRLVEEFAVDAGMSPFLTVLPEDGGRRLRAAIESVVDATTVDTLDDLARRLEIYRDERTDRHDWIRPAAELMELARSNRITSDALPGMAERSATGLLALFPTAAPDGAALDRAIDAELARAIAHLAREDDGTAMTRRARQTLRGIQARRRARDHRWSDWAKAACIEAGAACRPGLADLVAVASEYPRHPTLHDDLRRFIAALFDVVGRALGGFAEWKARRRVVDFTDMVDAALRIVEDPHIAAELADRLELVVVDEFQDTSPLQLALFTRLHRLAGRSVWVGDGKQCIFEYAGADPVLMDAVVAGITSQSGVTERLDRNFRSRPELVAACSELFVHAFDDVRSTAVRAIAPGLADTPPLGVWWLETKNASDDAVALAGLAARMLAAPEQTCVVDRVTGGVRALRPSDIGILVATNREAKQLAASLQRRGVQASMPRDGLLATPEGHLLEAALRWLVEPGDTRSLAILEALGGWNGLGPDEWLASKLEAERSPPPAWLEPLARLRPELEVLSPAEVLERAIWLLDAPTFCARWPDPEQRLGNLDALGALAARYEDRCARDGETASVAGLVRYFDQARRVELVRDDERASDDQFVRESDDAVTVSTYHRAKGLEWPVVILASLDRSERRDAFEPCAESERDHLDVDDPLAGRWLRYWPWPFGRLGRLPVADAAQQSPEGRRVAERERRERLRLLYVGFTRARDHLVLAARWTKSGGKTGWLDELEDANGKRLLELPASAHDGALETLRLGTATATCRVWRGSGDENAALRGRAHGRLTRRPRQPPNARPYQITPSRLGAGEDTDAIAPYRVGKIHALGAELATPRTTDWEALGHGVHAFLAADPHGEDLRLRIAIARRLIAGHALVGTLEPGALLSASDRLRELIAARWPGAAWGREVPISAPVPSPTGERRIDGVIDLLLELDDGVVLIDHKTYPAPSHAAVFKHVQDHLSQLGAYAHALERCGRVVLACCVHFPIAGRWVDLERAGGASRDEAQTWAGRARWLPA